MHILRNAAITAAVLSLGVGTAAQASGSRHGDDNRTGYYGQSSASPAPGAYAAGAKVTQRQVIATEAKNAYLFAPKPLKIKVGTRVTWLNKSDAEHNVTFDKNTKVNMDFKPNKSVSYTFTKAGTYKYHCEYHPYMTGTVTVTR
jgi:plastocyanin